jgi:hypothetical protein
MLRGTTTVWKYALMLLGGYILLQISDFKHVKSSAVTWVFFITNILTFMFVADQLVWKVKASAPKKKPNPNKDFVAPKAPASAVAEAQAVIAKPASLPPQTIAEQKSVEPTKTVTLASLQEAAKAAAKTAPQPSPSSAEKVAVQQPAPIAKAAPKPAYRVIPKVRKKILFQFAGRGPWGQLMGISSQGIHVRGLAEPPADIATREIEISLNNGLTLRTRLARRKEHDYYFDYTSLSSEEIKSLNQWLHSLSDAA